MLTQKKKKLYVTPKIYLYIQTKKLNKKFHLYKSIKSINIKYQFYNYISIYEMLLQKP